MREMKKQQFMKLALLEAKKGVGRTHPNPMVGCVLVKDGEMIGETPITIEVVPGIIKLLN